MSSENKILGVRWFSGRDTVGVVRVDVPYDGIKYYVGAGFGHNEHDDQQHIANWGARFPNDAGDLLFGIIRESANEN